MTSGVVPFPQLDGRHILEEGHIFNQGLLHSYKSLLLMFMVHISIPSTCFYRSFALVNPQYFQAVSVAN